MTTERQISEGRKAYIRSRIEKIVVIEDYTDRSKIYIDFHGKHRAHWYVMFIPQNRVFGRCVKLDRDGSGTGDAPLAVRAFLITLIPPDIIARCTTAALLRE